MAIKPNIGDYVYVTHEQGNGTIINDRGGYVGRWLIQLDKGGVRHSSSRDIIVIKPTQPPLRTASLEQKVDALIEHFGLVVTVEPEKVTIKVRDEKSKD